MNRYTEALRVVETVLVEHCDIARDAIREDVHLQADLGLDSMALLNLALEIENMLEMCLEEDPEHPPETVAEVAHLIAQRLEETQ